MSTYHAREDSNSANNPALNLTNDPAVELTFVPSGGSGDVILETNGGAADPDTLVEIDGVQYSFTYEFTGTFPTAKRDGSQQVPDEYEGSSVSLISVQDYPSPGDTTRFAFMPDEAATQADMDAFGNGAIDVQNLDTSPPPTPVCFVRGTLIATPEGERAVEDLAAGDAVLTGAGEVARLRWVSHSRFSAAQLLFRPQLRPVRIPRGYLGRGMPHTDLWVSQQHRILVRGWAAELHLGAGAVLVPARHLVGTAARPGRDRDGGVEYFHLLLDRHDILLSNGLESESFFPGEEALKSLDPAARLELAAVQAAGGQPFRQTVLPTVTAAEARLLGVPRAA